MRRARPAISCSIRPTSASGAFPTYVSTKWLSGSGASWTTGMVRCDQPVPVKCRSVSTGLAVRIATRRPGATAAAIGTWSSAEANTGTVTAALSSRW